MHHTPEVGVIDADGLGGGAQRAVGLDQAPQALLDGGYLHESEYRRKLRVVSTAGGHMTGALVVVAIVGIAVGMYAVSIYRYLRDRWGI
jgi:hypothetical protein